MYFLIIFISLIKTSCSDPLNIWNNPILSADMTLNNNVYSKWIKNPLKRVKNHHCMNDEKKNIYSINFSILTLPCWHKIYMKSMIKILRHGVFYRLLAFSNIYVVCAIRFSKEKTEIKTTNRYAELCFLTNKILT